MSASLGVSHATSNRRLPGAFTPGAAFGAAAAVIALGVGLLVPAGPQFAFVLTLGLVGVAALVAPPTVWVGAALVATVSFKGLSDVGLLPSIATYADIFLVWGALAAALLRTRAMPHGRVDSRAKPILFVLAGLSLCATISALFSHAELMRPVVYLLLLGLPLALVAALLLDPPGPRAWRALGCLVVAVALIQIPFAASQFLRSTNPDDVQGTLVGAGAGAHVMSAIAVIGALWLVAGEGNRPARLLLAGALLVLPFMADAKQVIFAAPAMLLAGNWHGRRDVLLRVGVVVAAAAVLVAFVPAGGIAERFLQTNAAGQGGKQATAELVLHRLTEDPANLVFGMGPAESVSRAAFMTTPLLLHEDSPLHRLGLSPAELPSTARTTATHTSGGGTSFNSGISSALGLFGDLGIAGLAVYLASLGLLWSMLRRQRTAHATAATCGLALFALLGVVFDWWEQPPFSILVGVLVAASLTERKAPVGEMTGHRPRLRPPPGSDA